MKLSADDIKQSRELVTKEVSQLQRQLQDAELTAAACGAVGSESEAKEARQIRTMTDRKLEEAKQRQTTAQARLPRLTQDAINRATDSVNGARRGKSTGMSHKAVRAELRATESLISEGKLHCDCNKRDFDQRDIELILLGFQMALGENKCRSVLAALREKYISEGRKGWVSNGRAAPVEAGMEED